MTPAWKPSASVDQLRKEVNKLWPKRDKRSDGIVGDIAHSNRVSDHNPDPRTGIVRAIDIDKDLTVSDKNASWKLAEQLRKIAMNDGRIKYIIHMGQICSGTFPGRRWRWRQYTGDNPHHHHIHVSFTQKGDLDGKPFGITK